MSADLRITVNFSWRYGVVGWYKDREKPIVRLYLPFVRVSVESLGKGETLVVD